MAISLEFLSKTKMGAMKDIMATKGTGVAQQNKSTNSLFMQKTENKQQKADIANMDSSDLMKYVYNNTGNTNNNIKLPAHIKYDNRDFAINGKSFDEAVKMISDKTGDSKSRVEQKLKKDFGTQTSGGSMNFQA